MYILLIICLYTGPTVTVTAGVLAGVIVLIAGCTLGVVLIIVVAVALKRSQSKWLVIDLYFSNLQRDQQSKWLVIDLYSQYPPAIYKEPSLSA